MLDTSTAGRGLVKSRSLDVEANLLSERSAHRARLVDQVRRRSLLLALTLIFCVTATPPLMRWNRANGKQLEIARKALATSTVELKRLQDLQNQTAPSLKQSEMSGKVARRADRYSKQLYRLFGASRPNMVLSSLRVELLAGELRINARGNAESYEAYQSYVARLQESFGAQNVIPRSARSSPELGAEGIVFELIQKGSVNEP